MNRLSLANVIAFIIGVAILVGFLDREGRLSRLLRGTSYEEFSTESPRPRAFKLSHGEEETTSASMALPEPPKAQPSPTPVPKLSIRAEYKILSEMRNLTQWDGISFWLSREWDIPRADDGLFFNSAAQFLISEVPLRTKLFNLKPGDGILFRPSFESDLDKVLRAGAAGKFQFESKRTFLNAGKLKSTEAFCVLDLDENKFGNELHYEPIERGILVESTKILKDKKGFSGVEIRGVVRPTKLLGQIVSISCYIKDVAGVQRYQELELIHLFYNLGTKGRLVPIKKK